MATGSGNIRGAAEARKAGKPGKVMGLTEAIRDFLRPGMTIHLAAGIGGPSAAICEIMRQHWGRAPGFTVIQSTVTGHALNLVHCGLVRKLVCAACPDISASARPSRIVQRALETHAFELENWSLCSLQQRLMAGAFGVPFMPTKSILGSSIAVDNAHSFREIADPFGSGASVGLVQALRPDISIVHACVGDAEGNVIPAAPYGDDLWGALASREGVLVTVERLVPTSVIQQYAALVKVPSYRVQAVIPAPLGLHPFSLANPGIGGLEPYDQDTEFLNELHTASLSPATLDAWLRQWVIGCSHGRYLEKLGSSRIDALKRSAQPAATAAAPVSAGGSVQSGDYEPREMMIVALAREILNSVAQHGHKLILAGAGIGATAAFLAYCQLREQGDDIELVTGNGQLGYTPVPGRSILTNEAGVRSAKMLTDTVTMQGVLVGGAHSRCLSILGAGQIDKFGNINSTRSGKGTFLVGSGGANDAMNAREVFLCVDQSPERFAAKLAHLTACGTAVTTVVSTAGVFRKGRPHEEMYLAACFTGGQSPDLAALVDNVRQQCGWDLKVSSQVAAIPGPTESELRLLRWIVGSSPKE